jgi:glycosyltransferase involved in cell wall biosynthesis
MPSFNPLEARVSVVIPNFNRAELVNETVRNVLSQSLTPSEVIVVDDGSTDDSVASLRAEFGTSIRLIQQCNRGPGAARNAGLKIATGEFIWLMDSDDLASLNKLRTQVETLAREDADVVYSPWMKVSIRGKYLSPENVVLQQRAIPKGRSCLEWFLNDWSNVFQQCLIRRSLLERTSGFKTDLHCGEDGEFFVRLLLSGAKVAFDGRSLTLYRLNNSDKLTSSISGDCRRHTSWAAALVEMYRSVRADCSDSIQAGYLRRLKSATLDLQLCHSDHSSQIAECAEILGEFAFRVPGRFSELVRRIQGGFLQRVVGHRWGRAFQCGPLTTPQVSLIEEMGFQIQ